MAWEQGLRLSQVPLLQHGSCYGNRTKEACSENFGFFKNPLVLCEYVFVLISGVGYGTASDFLVLLEGCDACLLWIVYIWNYGDY